MEIFQGKQLLCRDDAGFDHYAFGLSQYDETKLNEWVEKADVLSPKALKEVRAREKIIEAQVAMSPIRALGESIKGMDFKNFQVKRTHGRYKNNYT